MLLFAFLVFPFQGSLFNDVDKATQEETNEQGYCNKSVPSQAFEVDGIGIEEDHFHIKKHEENGGEKIVPTDPA